MSVHIFGHDLCNGHLDCRNQGRHKQTETAVLYARTAKDILQAEVLYGVRAVLCAYYICNHACSPQCPVYFPGRGLA